MLAVQAVGAALVLTMAVTTRSGPRRVLARAALGEPPVTTPIEEPVA